MAATSSMSTGQKRKGTPNKRWTKETDDVLIPCLAEMAKAGLKVDKSFKHQAFVEAANTVNTRFPAANMDAENVENHMRTMKMKYQDIKKVLALSGVGWNEDLKMVVLEDEAYRSYVEAFPKAKEILNKPIPHFNDLRLVCGDDHATGEFARTIFHQFGSQDCGVEGGDVHVVADEDIDTEPSNTNNQQGEPARSSATPVPRNGRASKVNAEATALDQLGCRIDHLASSIEKTQKKRWKEKLSDALWSMEGYDDSDMQFVYVTLCKNRDLAEDFYMRKPSLRKLFLDEFIAERRASSE